MSAFRFLHAADLHLDSPLIGLSRKSADFAGRVDRASRDAFNRLVSLAIEQRCRFVVLAGDVFDGELRDFASGLFFLAGISRLRGAGIRVFLVAGNHDAENRFFSKLAFADNVHVFGHRQAERIVLDDVGAVVHGRSFDKREVTENIALSYAPPSVRMFDVGVLHTACAGSEGPHASYAPCTVEQLVNHGYRYWALGHVHARATLSRHPHVVYPGNLQGRDPRETGAKGATVVEVADGEVVACTHHDLDAIRWASIEADVGRASDLREALEHTRDALEEVGSSAAGRPVALRLTLEGETDLHEQLLLRRSELRDDLEALLETLPHEIWLEKLALRTRPTRRSERTDPTISGRLGEEVRRLAGEPGIMELLDRSLADVRIKLPASARAEDLLSRVRAEAPARAVELALSMVGRHADR